MKPKPDLKDYAGNLPLFASVASNDVEMIKVHFKRGRDYFSIRNYKYETLFHVAACHDSIDALKHICGKSVFVEELIKKDFKGDTPIHLAAKKGSMKVLEFFLETSTRSFIEMQNDFGLSVIEACS